LPVPYSSAAHYFCHIVESGPASNADQQMQVFMFPSARRFPTS
jgi:hypothetical protein